MKGDSRFYPYTSKVLSDIRGAFNVKRYKTNSGMFHKPNGFITFTVLLPLYDKITVYETRFLDWCEEEGGALGVYEHEKTFILRLLDNHLFIIDNGMIVYSKPAMIPINDLSTLKYYAKNMNKDLTM